MAMGFRSGSIVSFASILIGVVCIVAANLLLELLRHLVDLPFSDSLQSMLATGVGVVAWFAIVAGLKR